MKYIGLITVRSRSSRLKKKFLLNFGKFRVIEHIIKRCLVNKITPIVCTTKNTEDNIIINIAKKLKVNFFRGSEKNKIKRWHDCAKKFQIKHFHTIDADDPFFDPELKPSLYGETTSNPSIQACIAQIGSISLTLTIIPS